MDIMGVPIWKYLLVVLAIALLATSSIFLFHPIPSAFLDRCVQQYIGPPSLRIEVLKLESSRSDDPGRKRCGCMKAKEFDKKLGVTRQSVIPLKNPPASAYSVVVKSLAAKAGPRPATDLAAMLSVG